MLLNFVLILGLIIHSSYANDKIAMIDTGINIDLMSNKKKLVYSEFSKCLYSFDIENRRPCSFRDVENHGNIVFRILSKNMPDNTILSYIYASHDGILKKIAKFKFPSSLKDVYDKRLLYTKTSENIAEAIDLAINNQAKIVNISLSDKWLNSKKLESKIQKNPNIIFIFAAGNHGHDLNIDYNKSYPCSYKFKNTICVGALDKKGNIAEYSNYGNDVDIFVKPIYHEGTSFSAPIVAIEAYQLIKKHGISETIELIKKKHRYIVKK